MMYTFGLNETPKELQKKILIFQQFKKYFEEEINSNGKENKGSPNKVNKKSGKTIKGKKEKKEEKEPEKEVENVYF